MMNNLLHTFVINNLQQIYRKNMQYMGCKNANIMMEATLLYHCKRLQ